MNSLEHRRAKCCITLKDKKGLPMSGCRIHAELQNHEFRFGSNIFWLVDMLDPSVPAETRALCEIFWEAWQELLNFATLPFYQKRYEPIENQPRKEALMRAAKWLNDHGFTAKGHPLCWHELSPEWLLGRSHDAVLENQLARIRRDVGAFRGQVDIWDVINESVAMPNYDHDENAIAPLCRHMGRVPLIKTLFDTARETNPDATLLINDYSTGEDYRQVIEDCLEAGVCIDAIGIQSHQHGSHWSEEKLAGVLERFSSFGLPLHFTENTILSGAPMPKTVEFPNDYKPAEWASTPEGEEQQARLILRMADTLFAHPQVEAFTTTWNFTDYGAWLGAPAGFLRKDGSRKPVFDAMKQRIRHDWHTSLDLMTDENGCCTVEGFRGEYSLQCEGKKATFTLGKNCQSQIVSFS